MQKSMPAIATFGERIFMEHQINQYRAEQNIDADTKINPKPTSTKKQNEVPSV